MKRRCGRAGGTEDEIEAGERKRAGAGNLKASRLDDVASKPATRTARRAMHKYDDDVATRETRSPLRASLTGDEPCSEKGRIHDSENEDAARRRGSG